MASHTHTHTHHNHNSTAFDQLSLECVGGYGSTTTHNEDREWKMAKEVANKIELRNKKIKANKKATPEILTKIVEETLERYMEEMSGKHRAIMYASVAAKLVKQVIIQCKQWYLDVRIPKFVVKQANIIIAEVHALRTGNGLNNKEMQSTMEKANKN